MVKSGIHLMMSTYVLWGRCYITALRWLYYQISRSVILRWYFIFRKLISLQWSGLFNPALLSLAIINNSSPNTLFLFEWDFHWADIICCDIVNHYPNSCYARWCHGNYAGCACSSQYFKRRGGYSVVQVRICIFCCC